MNRLKLKITATLLLTALAHTAETHAQKGVVLPPDVILGYALDWLAPSGQATTIPSEIVVYSLSCGKCIDELGAIAQGYAPAPSHFMLASFRKVDRDVSIPLLSFGLSDMDPKARRSALLDLLRIYAADPDHYQNNPSDWITTIESQWPSGSSYEGDTISRAFAANILDMQARIMALADRMETPGTIPLDAPTYALEVARGSERYSALIATLSLSWLRPGLATKEDADRIPKKARSIDPMKALNASQWKELKAWALGGAYWIWGGKLGPDVLENIIDWQAQYHLLPDDAARLERHRQWFDQTIERASKGPLSPLEAFGLVDIEALASPAWGAAQADAQQQLVFASLLGGLTVPAK